MFLSKRIEDIIKILLNTHGYISVQEIAERLSVSQRTVYREIPEIAKLLQAYDLELVSTSKKGLIIKGNTKDMMDKLQILQSGKMVNASERTDYLLLYMLLQNDYMKAEAAAFDNDVSVTTIRTDFEKISQKLKETDVSLISKKGMGYKITGSIVSRNQLSVNILLAAVEIQSVYTWMSISKQEDMFLNLLSVHGYDRIIRNVHTVLQKIFKEDEYLGDYEYIRFLFLLSFMMQAHMDDHFYPQEGIESDVKYKTKEIIQELEAMFSTSFHDGEKAYVDQILTMCITTGNDIYGKSDHFHQNFHEFVNYVENQMGIHFQENEDILMSLYVHMDKALRRVRSGISVSNSLLKKTKEEYAELFYVIQEGLEKTFPKIYFPEDEIGYLLFYFAVALDQTIKRSFRVLVVCSGGMGSSRMLANRVEQEIPEINVSKITSLMGLEAENIEDYDLILSTIPLYLDKTRYLQVSPLLNTREVQWIQEKIQNHKYSKLKKINVQKQQEELSKRINSIDKLSKINRLSSMGINLIGKLHFYEYKGFTGIYEDIGKTLAAHGIETKRESMSYLSYFILPTTKILYCEMDIKEIHSPFIFIHTYSEEEHLLIEHEDFHKIIYLLKPAYMEKFEYQMLMQILKTLLEDKDILNSIEYQKEEKLQNTIAYHIDLYLQNL